MFDPRFDPLRELEDCKHEILEMSKILNQLIDAHNKREQFFAELTTQHRKLVNINKKLGSDVVLLQLEVEHLREKIHG